MCRHRKNTQQGFTLLEMTIVMLASGFLLVVMMGFLKYRDVYEVERQHQNMERIQFGLAEYHRVFGHYPCPADLNDAYGSANFGMSSNFNGGKAIVPPEGGSLCSPAMVNGNLAIGDVPVKSLNFAVGCLTNSVADVIALGIPNPRATLIFSRLQKGMQTYKSKSLGMNSAGGTRLDYCLPDNVAVDIHENKLTYAVSIPSVQTNTYAFNSGTLNLFDQNGNSAAAQPGHYIVFSHGEDGKGAIRQNTNNPTGIACNMAGGLKQTDDENCDGDNDFLIATIADAAGSAVFNDDIVAFTIFGQKQEMEMWDRRMGAGTENLSFNNTMPLYVGNVNPASAVGARMAIGGDLNAGTSIINATNGVQLPNGDMQVGINPGSGNASAVSFEAQAYCYPSGSSPFGTPSARCP